MIIIFRSSAKRNDSKLYVDTTESIIALAGYNAKVLVRAEKKELKSKLLAAKETGDGITDCTNEYNEKFGDKKKEADYLAGVEKLIVEKAKAKAEESESVEESKIEEDKNSILDEMEDVSDEADEEFDTTEASENEIDSTEEE